MTESIFVGDGDLFTPTEQARGPWDPRALHGGAPAALIAAAFERMQPGAELPFARLSFEFLRPVPMAPLKLSTRISRPGRRVQALEAELSAEGATVCRARALRLVPTPEELPELALTQVEAVRPRVIAPASDGEQVHFALDDMERKSFAASAMEMRFLRGKPLVGGLPERDIAHQPELSGGRRADAEPSEPSAAGHVPSGAATVWMRLRHRSVCQTSLLPRSRALPPLQISATEWRRCCRSTSTCSSTLT